MSQQPSKKLRRPGRKRRLAGWLLLAIGVLITGVWGASRWWVVGYTGKYSEVAATGGTFLFQTGIRANGAGWVAAMPGPDFAYWRWMVDTRFIRPPDSSINLRVAAYIHFNSPGYSGHAFEVVLWPFALASLLGGGFLLWSGRRARRRAMTGVCPKCGYDLRGLAAGAQCPECGGGASPAA